MMKIFTTAKKNIGLKLLFSASLVLMFCCPGIMHAQNIQGEFIGGFNLSQVDGDEVVGYRKIGFNGGVGAALPLGKSWFVSVETLFNQKGAYKKYPPNSNNLNLPYYNLRLNYAEIPMLIHYNDRDQITIGLGLAYSRLVSMRETEHGVLIDWATSTGPYKSEDLNILVDFRLRAFWKVHFNFRYAYSLGKIRTRDYNNTVSTWSRDQFNNLLSFRLVFVFNEKLK
ncbi:MAG: hypothetical protein A2W93_13955 [Bacteroidetes bacterium GWF2_43_63]|nr:MAG: hypothetical protein A2W94_00525 [Bacteroidetes bacterium GWE2_42_42]OFY52452.1 MAG: hypothetical protein A2W93_13955 [Bacteroidetes bacterium GWF2_43_63]HBG71358.1 hypothetical protein [Bacteroidales bacterium]HCB60892.1 hypothetical protein [Bacteroidales bacterium]HCY23933.1 hypothetical protein [Bacteroidales bacterium]